MGVGEILEPWYKQNCLLSFGYLSVYQFVLLLYFKNCIKYLLFIIIAINYYILIFEYKKELTKSHGKGWVRWGQ
jgi:hypothetical protein